MNRKTKTKRSKKTREIYIFTKCVNRSDLLSKGYREDTNGYTRQSMRVICVGGITGSLTHCACVVEIDRLVKQKRLSIHHNQGSSFIESKVIYLNEHNNNNNNIYNNILIALYQALMRLIIVLPRFRPRSIQRIH